MATLSSWNAIRFELVRVYAGPIRPGGRKRASHGPSSCFKAWLLLRGAGEYRTEQQRCQNIGRYIFAESDIGGNLDSKYEVSMKMDGTSFTGFYVDGEEGVCGRNWELKTDEDNQSNSLVRMYIDSKLQECLRKLGKNYAVQGELMGPGIQQNREGFKTHKLFIFDIYSNRYFNVKRSQF